MDSRKGYATLDKYNTMNGLTVPQPSTTVQGFYVVPDWMTAGYQTLTSRRAGLAPSVSGYFNLSSAYGDCGTQSVSYQRQACQTAFAPQYVYKAIL
jgi:hypothetical protein